VLLRIQALVNLAELELRPELVLELVLMVLMLEVGDGILVGVGLGLTLRDLTIAVPVVSILREVPPHVGNMLGVVADF